MNTYKVETLIYVGLESTKGSGANISMFMRRNTHQSKRHVKLI